MKIQSNHMLLILIVSIWIIDSFVESGKVSELSGLSLLTLIIVGSYVGSLSADMTKREAINNTQKPQK